MGKRNKDTWKNPYIVNLDLGEYVSAQICSACELAEPKTMPWTTDPPRLRMGLCPDNPS